MSTQQLVDEARVDLKAAIEALHAADAHYDLRTELTIDAVDRTGAVLNDVPSHMMPYHPDAHADHLRAQAVVYDCRGREWAALADVNRAKAAVVAATAQLEVVERTHHRNKARNERQAARDGNERSRIEYITG